MLRINVVGSSCSGKTTIARQIAVQYGIPHIELDAVFWQADWTPLPLDQYRSAVQAHASGDAWVIDGNYSRVRDIVWARATDVVWMNLPLATVLWRVIKRTTRRVISREELFSGNRETVRDAFLSRDSLIVWVIRTHRRRINELRGTLESGEYPHLRVYEIKQPSDARALLARGLGAG